jgi:RNA polymerase sigma-70 factor (ECF subfamily)
MSDRTLLARRFEHERPRLTAVATRLLGSAADADDAVQEAWLRLERADVDTIDNLEGWLTTVVSRLALDLLRAPRRTRERSWQVEPWLDEPVSAGPDPAELADRDERVGGALLLVLDLLSPAERLSFVLHDVFDRSFDEIGAILDRSPDAARQLASRGRRRLRAGSSAQTSDRRPARVLVEAWLAAARDGDIAALLGLLDDGAVLRADYGTATQVVSGAQAIARQAVLSGRLAAHSFPVVVGGRPGVAAVIRGRVVSVMAFGIADRRIVRLDVLADPSRLPAPGVVRGRETGGVAAAQ